MSTVEDEENRRGREDVVRFVIPSLPSSSNSIYQILWGLHRIQMKPAVAFWKSKAKEYVPRHTIRDGTMVALSLTFSGGWYYKNGKLKREDLPNLLKVVVDAVAEKGGWDDKLIRELVITCQKTEGIEQVSGEIHMIPQLEKA